MSDFTEKNWLEALTSVYQKSASDPSYRSLCLSDPVAALRQVSDIDLPPTLKFKFFDKAEDFVYPYLLPPVPAAGVASDEHSSQLIRWATTCTWPTGHAPA